MKINTQTTKTLSLLLFLGSTTSAVAPMTGYPEQDDKGLE